MQDISVYGGGSVRMVQQVAEGVAALPLTVESAAFQAFSLVVAGYYCWMIYQFRAQAGACIKSTVRVKTDESAGARSVAGAGNKQLYDRFIAAAMVLGALCTGIAAAKFTAVIVSPEWTAEWVKEWAPVIMVCGAGIAAALVVLVQTTVLKAAGSLTFTTRITDEIVRTKKNHLAAAAVLIAPAVLMYTGMNPARDQIMGYWAAAVVVVAFIMFAAGTMRLFIAQKVSLLVWFLYLCALEIFPVALAVLLVAKNV